MIKVRENSSGVEEGKRFSKWTVIGKPFRMGHKWFAVCQCACGKIQVVPTHGMAKGRSVGCRSCHIRQRSMTHGETRAANGRPTSLYVVWRNMNDRCRNSDSHNFKDYGARGISVCLEWSESYEEFRSWASANGYEEGLEIDRRDNNGSYSPGNCWWVTKKVNCRNRRSSHNVTVNGITKTLAEWEEETGIQTSTIRYRIKSGWTPEDAVLTPAREMKV